MVASSPAAGSAALRLCFSTRRSLDAQGWYSRTQLVGGDRYESR